MHQCAHNVDRTGHLASSRGCARGSATHTSNLASANHESGEDRGQCHVSPGWIVSTNPRIHGDRSRKLTNPQHRSRKSHPPPKTNLYPTRRPHLHRHRRSNLVASRSLSRYRRRLPPKPAPAAHLAAVPTKREYKIVVSILATIEEQWNLPNAFGAEKRHPPCHREE